MDVLLAQLGDAIAAFLGQPAVRLVLVIGLGYWVLVWLASALWVFTDMGRRTVNPIWPYAIAGIVIVASPLLFPLAVVVHFVIRPATTTAERRMERLRDAALISEVDLPSCPSCRRMVDPGWLVCPTCRTALAHRCEQCGHAVGLDWDACPWCGRRIGPPAGLVATS